MAALIPTAAHWLAVAVFYPDDLAFWIRKIYFGFFLREGISGGKFAGNVVDPRWIHPIWYYAGVLYRDHFFLLPVILLGISPLLREYPRNRELLWISAAGIVGVVPFSLMKIKEPLYILSCAIFVYFLTAACLSALVRRISSLDRFSPIQKSVVCLMLLLSVLFPCLYAWGVKPRELTSTFIVVHSVTVAVILMLFWLGRRATPRIAEITVYGACAVAVIASFFYHGITRRPRDETITRMIQPYIENNSPQALSLVATEYKAYQFYAFRRGCYWDELPLAQSPETVFGSPALSHAHAFVIEPEDLVKPQMAPWIAWLQSHTVEKTAELNSKLGAESGLRLFVR